jgi:hypothetical protein
MNDSYRERSCKGNSSDEDARMTWEKHITSVAAVGPRHYGTGVLLATSNFFASIRMEDTEEETARAAKLGTDELPQQQKMRKN